MNSGWLGKCGGGSLYQRDPRALGVARSSASAWVRDVPLGPEQRAALISRVRLETVVAGELKAKRAREVRRADPEVIVFFARFLREHFEVTDAQMTLSCNLFADHEVRQREIEGYCLRRLGLPRSALRNSTVNRYSKYSQKKRMNRLPWGTCSLRVHSTRIVQTIYGSIQEYGGFERPEWLD